MELTEEELEIFFYKYNLIELDVLNSILGYVHEYDTKKIKIVLTRVHKEKEINCYSDYKVLVQSYGFNLLDKNNILNDKELNFLYKLVEDAAFFYLVFKVLQNIQLY